MESLTGAFSRRKGTLYVCAGLRCIWDLLYDDASQEAVGVAERAADGTATADEIRHAQLSAECPTFGFDFEPQYIRGHARDGNYNSRVRRLLERGVYSQADILGGEERIGDEDTVKRLSNAAHIAYHCLSKIDDGKLDEHLLEHLSRQAEWPGGWLVREVFEPPFRSANGDLGWQTRTVASLAQAAYDERSMPNGHLDAVRLAILADAIQEAGCTDESILTHLRSPGPHVRGCWAVELLLGKE
jgi:hypothetical protein